MIIKTYEIGEALYEVTYIMEENIWKEKSMVFDGELVGWHAFCFFPGGG